MATLMLASCSSTANWEAMTPDARSQLLKHISRKCGLPADSLKPVGPAGLTFNLPPDAKYPQVDCLLAEMKNVPGVKLGFVGNEVYDENMK